MCWISKGAHKETQSGFHISTMEANLAEISYNRLVAVTHGNLISGHVLGFMAVVKSAGRQ